MAKSKRKTWRCFHCDEVFRGEVRAALHFGTHQHSEVACQIDAVRLRELEAQLSRYRHEDTDLHREIHRLQSEHSQALMRAEESGYAKGLRDGKMLWNTDGPPHDGSSIVAIGRVIASDEFSTWSEPFVCALVWEKDRSDYEGWHYSSDHMTVARTLGDEVMIDYWAPFPKEDVISRKFERLQIDQPIGGSLGHEGECAKSYGGHPCTCEKEAP